MLRSPNRTLRILGVLTAVVLVMAACGKKSSSSAASGDTGGATTTYKLAFVGPLTGPNAALGLNIKQGAEVAADEANAGGGKTKFEIVPFDSQGSGTQASTLKDNFINDNAFLGAVGPTFSGETKAILKDFEAAHMPMISASATAVDIPATVPGGKSFHRLVPDDAVQGQGVSDYLTKKLKTKSVFYIDDKSDYGKGLASDTKKTLEAAQIKTAGTDEITPGEQSYLQAVNNVKAASPKPDIVFYGGYYSDAGRLAKQLHDGGAPGVFMSGDGSLDQGLIDAAGASGAEGAIITCACKLATPDAGGALGSFATKYKAKFNKNPGTYSTEGYDAATILIKGIKAGNTTRQKLLDYTNSLGSYTGIGKTIEFEANGNIKTGDVYVYEVKSGKLAELGTVGDLTK
jgi:branched-chain amino acid transport system substrate-binding protein